MPSSLSAPPSQGIGAENSNQKRSSLVVSDQVMPLIGACCELGWCEPVEARVWSVGVVVDPPVFDDPASLAEVGEQMLVEALVKQAAVGALHEAILHRLTWRDVVPFDAVVLLPSP